MTLSSPTGPDCVWRQKNVDLARADGARSAAWAALRRAREASTVAEIRAALEALTDTADADARAAGDAEEAAWAARGALSSS